MRGPDGVSYPCTRHLSRHHPPERIVYAGTASDDNPCGAGLLRVRSTMTLRPWTARQRSRSTRAAVGHRAKRRSRAVQVDGTIVWIGWKFFWRGPANLFQQPSASQPQHRLVRDLPSTRRTDPDERESCALQASRPSRYVSRTTFIEAPSVSLPARTSDRVMRRIECQQREFRSQFVEYIAAGGQGRGVRWCPARALTMCSPCALHTPPRGPITTAEPS